MANRFGFDGTFFYTPGDSFSGTIGGTSLPLATFELPQYPFETFTETDRASYRSRTGRKWTYQNYALTVYKFSWAKCSQDLRDRLRRMYDSNAVITFTTGGTNWGTFRLEEDTWQDSEVGYDLFDLNITLLESI